MRARGGLHVYRARESWHAVHIEWDLTEVDRRAILITGASRGIGFATARLLGQRGHTVIVSARDYQKCILAAQSLRDEGIDASPLELDVTSRHSIDTAARDIETRYGVLDSLVNNAGISLERGEGREDLDTAALWRRTFETNVVGVVAVTRALLPLLLESSAGRIVQVSSVMGSLTLHANPTSPIYEYKLAPAYDASKAAINSFTIHLAFELRATPVKVNAAHPGWVRTGMGGADAPMEPSEGAQTSAWLATLPSNGPTGCFYHLGEVVPW